MQYTLRDYQEKAIKDIRSQFSRGKKRILLVSPTGSGKTVVACEIIKLAMKKDSHCLFVANRRILVNQCSNKLRENGISHGVMMAGKTSNALSAVQVASIQTFISRKKDLDWDFIRPYGDLLIIDEAHRSTSKSFLELLDEYPASLVIGLTATPIRNDGAGLGNIYDEIVESSSIKKLTEKGWLVPERFVAPTMPDLKGVKITGGDYNPKQLDERMNTTQLTGDIVTHWIKFGKGRPTVAFASSIAHSKYIANVFRHNGVEAGHIDGEMSELEREIVLDDYERGRIEVLSNCQVLSEGFDSPRTSCIILARPTRSYPLYLQMIGRSLRPFENKKDTLVIDHSGAVYRHGFLSDIPEWVLTKKKLKPKEKKLKLAEKTQPFTCTQCDTVYKPTKENKSCPECGHTLEKKERVILIKQGRLKEVVKVPDSTAEKNQFLAELTFVCKQKNYNIGWASHKFKEKYGHWPYTKKVVPTPPSEKTLKFLQYLNIKRARSVNVRA